MSRDHHPLEEPMRRTRNHLAIVCLATLLACQCHPTRSAPVVSVPTPLPPSPAEAEAFLKSVDAEYLERATA